MLTPTYLTNPSEEYPQADYSLFYYKTCHYLPQVKTHGFEVLGCYLHFCLAKQESYAFLLPLKLCLWDLIWDWYTEKLSFQHQFSLFGNQEA